MTLGARPAAVSVPRRSALVVVLSASPGGGESSFPAGSLVPGPEQTPVERPARDGLRSAAVRVCGWLRS